MKKETKPKRHSREKGNIMAFAISGHTLPGIHSFEHCEALAAKRRARLTARQRNSAAAWSDNKLPLWDNHGRWSNQHHKRMEWVTAGEDSRWDLMLYRSAVVSYFKDGRIKLNAAYNSTSTRNFFEELRPYNARLMRAGRYGYAYCIGHTSGGRWEVKEYGDGVEWHEVNRACDDKWDQALLIDGQGTVLNPQPWTVKKTVSDKERRKELRAKLKPFTDWFDAMTKVGNSMRGVVAGVDIGTKNNWGYEVPTTDRAAVFALLSDLIEHEATEPTDMWRKACWYAMSANTSYYAYTRNEALYSIEKAAGIKAFILEQAFKNYDGYKEITVTTPPGVKPGKEG